jgi:hypothetical protein
MENPNVDYKNIPGWNMDNDPKNEPTYPIKEWTGDDHKRSNWKRPPQQPATVEVLHSKERPSLSAVFGTAQPPSGLSGLIRREAFKFSESEYGHWLNLLLADRVNVVEGIVSDLIHGHIPNIFAERGMKADWKYNRKEVARNIIIATVLTTAVIAFMMPKKKSKKFKTRRFK